MRAVLVSELPEGFHVVEGDRPGMATVIYDVTPEDFGTWTGAALDGGQLRLFPERSYRQKDLLARLGQAVDE